MGSDDSKSGVVYASMLAGSSTSDRISELSDTMTGLSLTQGYKDDVLGQTHSNDQTHNSYSVSDGSAWLSGLAESCGSCETTKTFMYDPYNAYVGSEKFEYSFDGNDSTSRIASDELGFPDVGLPLVNYFPDYNVDNDVNVKSNYSHNVSPIVINKNRKQTYNGNTFASSNSLSTHVKGSSDNSTRSQYNCRNISSMKTATVFLKILATQLISGTIIGRGGKGLNWFRRKSKVDDIILSMPWELYPKTEYRTLLLKGSLKSVVKAACIVADLMSSKYSFTPEDRMMIMVVLPAVFLDAMEEINKNVNQNVMSIALFRDGTSQHHEIVALIKGEKSKVKDLVADISIAIADTMSPDKYCFVSYSKFESNNSNAQVSDSGSDTLKKKVTWPFADSNVTQKSPDACTRDATENDNVESLFSDWKDNAEEYDDTVSISTITSIIKNNPKILKSATDLKIQVTLTVPDLKVDDIRTFSLIYNCEVMHSTNESTGTTEYKLVGSLDSCFATLLLMLSRTKQKDAVKL